MDYPKPGEEEEAMALSAAVKEGAVAAARKLASSRRPRESFQFVQDGGSQDFVVGITKENMIVLEAIAFEGKTYFVGIPSR